MARDPERLARFQREARAVAALNNPHIVTLHSVEQAEGVHFLTMELVEGQSLDRLVPSGGLPVGRILAVAVALAYALAAAHDKGIIHRDLKPANVMITNDGRVKVLDFGLAKVMRAADPADATITSAGHTEVGVMMGTPAYMSPEQVQGQALDHRTDIFSLGVILYELASGQRPFQGTSSAGLASAILRDTPRPLAEQRKDLSPGLARIIERCLAKSVVERFPSARDVRGALGSVTTEAPSAESAVPAAPPVPEVPPRGARQDGGFWVAVLPFKYGGPSADLTALAEGLSEDIVTGLSRFSYLRVIARSSTLRYANEATDVRAVGKELGARYVMEGSLRQAGPKLRIAVQLVDATTGAHLWAENYERTLSPEDIFALQDDLVPRIVSTVADWYGALPHSMSEAVRLKPSDQLSSYEAVLRSFGYFERITREEHAAVRAGLERAVEQAPGNADGWAMLSMMYGEEHRFGFNAQPDPLGRSLRAARRAVDAAHANNIAWLALAQALFFRKEFDTFRDAAERAIGLNPMDGSTLEYLGHLIAFAGDWDRGCELHERALRLNPNHPGWYWTVAFLEAYRKGDYPSARGYLRKGLMRGGGAQLFEQGLLAALYGQLGERESAEQTLNKILSQKPDFALTVRKEFLEKWYLPELVEQLMDGLRKAGLDIAAEERPDVALPVAEAASRSASTASSIAVLPFANMSAEQDQEYFSDGLTEEIINLLTRVPGLKVIARTSSFAFRGKDQDIRKIAEALDVRSILQGSVRRAGSRIRVTAQLINGLDGDHLWSERFDREMTEVFAVQDEIAVAIAGALKLTLTGKPADARLHEPNLAAYEAFLKGRHHYYGFSPEAFTTAEQDFSRAIALDPQWAEPHAALGELYFALAFYGWRPLDDMIPLAGSEARTAADMLPSHPMAHAVLGTIAALHDYDWNEAEEQFRLARTAQSLPLKARMLYAVFYLLALGRFNEAIEEMAKTIAQDPLNAFWRARLAWLLLCADRYDEAIVEARKALDFDATNYQARMMIALSLTFQGKLADARESAEAVFRIAAYDSLNTGLLAGLLMRAGEEDRAAQVLATMSGEVTMGMTMYHLVCSEVDAALDWYQKNIEQRRPNAPMVAFAGFLRPLRASPRWSKVARLMNLPGHAPDHTEDQSS